MVLNRRLTAVFAYKAAGDIPKVLYLGFDMNEAEAIFAKAKGKGYFELRVCRDIDLSWRHRDRSEPVPALKSQALVNA